MELGLTAEDLAAVEDYAEKLRHGDHSGPVSPTAANKPGFSISRPNVNNEQLSKLIIELERIHIESQESRDKLELTEVNIRHLILMQNHQRLIFFPIII